MKINWEHIFGNTSAEEECYEFAYGRSCTKKQLVKFLNGYGKIVRDETKKMLKLDAEVLRKRIKIALRRHKCI